MFIAEGSGVITKPTTALRLCLLEIVAVKNRLIDCFAQKYAKLLITA